MEVGAQPGPRARLRTDLLWLLRRVLQAAPGPVMLWAIIVVYLALSTAANLFVMRGTVNALVRADHSLSDAVPWLVWMVSLFAAGQATRIVLPYLRERVRVTGGQVLQAAALEKAGRVPIEAFESQGLFDLVRRIRSGSDRHGVDLVGEMFGVAEGLPSLLANAGALALVSFWFPLVVIGAIGLVMWQGAGLGRRERELDVRWTQRRRLGDYYARVLSARAYAPELRLWGLARLLLRRWQTEFGEYQSAVLRLDASNTVMGLTGMVGAPLVFGVSLAAIAMFGEHVQPGTAALVLAAVRDLVIGVSAYERVVRSFAEHAGYASDLRSFLALPEDRDTVQRSRPYRPPNRCIRLEDVSYRYPGQEKWALDGVNLEVEAGRVVAVVGANGAGKTTLGQLVVGLRRPTRGRVLVDGAELQHMDLQEFRRHCTAVFQQPVRYPDTLKRNIVLDEDGSAVDPALIKLMGPEQMSAVWSTRSGEDDPILEPDLGGVDLSGGQWQRLAIARAMQRMEADVVLFDEPTAALDPLAEMDLFETFVRLAAGRTVILISHRLGPTRLADEVVVLDRGHVLEAGTPARLIEGDGAYARMFARQAQWYR